MWLSCSAGSIIIWILSCLDIKGTFYNTKPFADAHSVLPLFIAGTHWSCRIPTRSGHRLKFHAWCLWLCPVAKGGAVPVPQGRGQRFDAFQVEVNGEVSESGISLPSAAERKDGE